MKKLKAVIAIGTLLTSVFLFSSCGANDNEVTTQSKQAEVTTTEAQMNAETTTNNGTAGDIGGGDMGLLKYRLRYYTVPAPFADFVGNDVYTEWAKVNEIDDPSVTNVMVMKKFIQAFNISREDFDRLNEEWAEIVVNGLYGVPMMNPQDFANQETDEVFNADIIYTFDDEIINAYYLSHDYPFLYADEYEKAVAAGTYQTRTAPEDYFYPNTRAEDRLTVTTAAAQSSASSSNKGF